MDAINEKRTEKRVNALVTVYCEDAKRFIAAYSLDLSRKGIFVRTREPFGEGDRVDMEFVLPDCNEVLKAIGEVRWVTKQVEQAQMPVAEKTFQSGMGIEFVEISQKVQTSLESYVGSLCPNSNGADVSA